MKIEQIIDEMQASLTKLRGQIRLTGTAAPKTATETAMEQHQEQYDLYNWLNGKTDKKPPIADRILTKLMKDDLREKEGQLKSEMIRRMNPIPDLPLNARVAKALGKPVMNGDIGWVYFEDNMPYPIPPYDTDLVAAMDGGLRYMEIINKNRPVSTLEFRMGIDFYGDLSGTVKIVQPDSLSPDTKNRYELVVHFGKHGKECCEANGILWAETKTEAICLAIVAHREGK